MADGIVAFFICVLLVAYSYAIIDGAKEHHRAEPLEEITVPVEKLPEPGTYEFEVQYCPDDIGELKQYFACVDKIRANMLRRDI